MATLNSMGILNTGAVGSQSGVVVVNDNNAICAPCNVSCAPITSSVGNNVNVNATDFAPQTICTEEFTISVPNGGADFVMGFTDGATTAAQVALANMKLAASGNSTVVNAGSATWPNKLLLYNDIQVNQNPYLLCGYLTFKTTVDTATVPVVTYVYIPPTGSGSCQNQEIETVCSTCNNNNNSNIVLTSFDASNVLLSNLSGMIIHFDNPGETAFTAKVNVGIQAYYQPSSLTKC